METVETEMQHVLKKAPQHLREEMTPPFFFSFCKYTGKSVREFLVEKFIPSKLKSAADTCIVSEA